MRIDYKKLKLKIIEVYDTQTNFAERMDMAKSSLNLRLNNKVEWKASEVARACELLEIPLSEAATYFFCLRK